ncbi:MAG: hypothetical protein HYT39_01130 [Candidatus Sungbacteria bacterium]|nr:hypothetical protein [Candidatus Sungbacteria bacterium]
MKQNIFIVATGLIAVLALLFIPLPAGYNTAAILPPAGAGFARALLGGIITNIVYCTCINAQLLIVGPPRAGNFLFFPGVTRLYAFGSVKIGSWVLGIASPAEQACLVYAGVGCVSAGSGKPIIMMGTSK